MKKNAFTLVELLAVVIILSLLSLITSFSVTKVVKTSKDKLYNTQINSVISAAKNWGADNSYSLPDTGECKYLTLKDLKDYGLIDDVIDPRSNKEISDDFKIYITSTTNKKGELTSKYSLTSNDDSCIPITEIDSDALDEIKKKLEDIILEPNGTTPGNTYCLPAQDYTNLADYKDKIVKVVYTKDNRVVYSIVNKGGCQNKYILTSNVEYLIKEAAYNFANVTSNGFTSKFGHQYYIPFTDLNLNFKVVDESGSDISKNIQVSTDYRYNQSLGYYDIVNNNTLTDSYSGTLYYGVYKSVDSISATCRYEPSCTQGEYDCSATTTTSCIVGVDSDVSYNMQFDINLRKNYTCDKISITSSTCTYGISVKEQNGKCHVTATANPSRYNQCTSSYFSFNLSMKSK